MAKICPPYEHPKWPELEQKLGIKGAMRMFMLFQDQPDAVERILERLDIARYTIEEKIDRLNSVSSKLTLDTSPDPKTGQPRHEFTIADNTAPDGRKRLPSVSELLDFEESTKYHGDDAGKEYSVRGQDIHTPFDELGKGISEANILATMQEKGIPGTFIEEVKSIFRKISTNPDGSSRGKIITEVDLSDLQSVAGRGDIILLAYDGTVEYYDIKTAHQTKRFQLNPKEKIWDPIGHYGGYKARRYPTQGEFYAKLIENTLGQPVSKKFIIPIEIKYKNFDPTQGYESINVLPFENMDGYGYTSKAGKTVDTFFGTFTPEVRPALLSNDDSASFLSSITGRMEDKVTDMDTEAEGIMLTRTKTMRGLLHYKDNHGYVAFKSQSDKALQKRQIIDEFLGKRESAKRDVVESFKNYLKTGEDAYLSGEGPIEKNLRIIAQKYMGVDRDVQVYELSDIPGFEKKTNWLVFQENQNFDLLYVGNDNLSSRLSLDKKQDFIRTLFANFYSGGDSKYLLNSTLSDTVLDAKRFEATLISMKLKEANPQAKFDRIAIYSLNETSGNLPLATNLSVLLPIVKKLVKGGRIPTPASYAKIFADDKSFDYANYGQDFVKNYTELMTVMNKIQDSKVYRGVEMYERNRMSKNNLMELISREINTIRATGKDGEYNHQLYLLSSMYQQLNEVSLSADIRPVSIFERFISQPSNVANQVIQDLYIQAKGAINRIRESFWQGYKKDFIKVQEQLFKESGIIDTIQDYTISNTSKYYEKLFKKVPKNVRQDDGTIKVEMINSFEFLDEGSPEFNRLTKTEQKYITEANDAIMTAAQIAGITWLRGRIPLMPASFMNRFYRSVSNKSGMNTRDAYKESFGKMFESIEDNFGINGSKKNDVDNQLSNIFSNQANDADSDGDTRPALLGFTQDGYVKIEDHSLLETNMEVVIDLFVMNAVRIKEFNKIAGAFDVARTLFEMQRLNFFNEDLGRNIDWVNVWKNAIIYNRSVDSGTIQNKAVTAINAVASATLIGFKPATAIVAYIGQELSTLSQSIANSLSRSDAFKFTHWVKAGTMIYNPKNNEKINLILQEYGMFDLDLSALVNGRRRYGNRSIFKAKFLYGMLNAGDWASRSRIIVAQMLNDGTWDAHSVVNGELVYDEIKDKRFYGEDGKAIKNYLKAALATEGHLTGKDDDPMEIRRMTRAYDDRLANKLKFEADQMIGGFDRETRGLYSYIAIGKLMGLFKTWLPARLNRGFDRPFESMVNGSLVIETDAKGVKVAVWKGQQMEGIMHSLLAGIHWLSKLKDTQNQKPLTAYQRNNLYRLMSDMLLIGITMLVVIGLPDEDRESKIDDASANILRKSIGDLLSVYNAFQALELLYTPVAIEFTHKLSTQIWNIAAGVPDPEQNTSLDIMRQAPVTRHFTWLIDELEEE